MLNPMLTGEPASSDLASDVFVQHLLGIDTSGALNYCAGRFRTRVGA